MNRYNNIVNEISPLSYKDHAAYVAAIKAGIPEKAVVQYTPTMIPVEVGQSASVVTYDHPSAECNAAPFVRTTRVVSYDEGTGEFETRNSKYVLKK